MFTTLFIALITWVMGVAFISIYRVFSIMALGIPQFNEEGQITGYKSLLEYVFTGEWSENPVTKVIFYFMLIALAMLCLVAVAKVIIISFKGEEDGERITTKTIAERMIKALGLTLFVPILIIAINFVTSNITQLIYNATTLSSTSVEQLTTKMIFGFSQNTQWTNTYQNSNAFVIGSGFNLVKFRDCLFYAPNGDIAQTVVQSFFGDLGGTAFRVLKNFFGTEAKAFRQLFNYVFLLNWVVLITMITGCGKGLLSCGKKLFDTILLEVSLPFATAMYPADNGKRTATHIQVTLVKTLGASMLIFAFNMFFIVFLQLGKAEVGYIYASSTSVYIEHMEDGLIYIYSLIIPTYVGNTEANVVAGSIGLAYAIFICMGAVSVQTGAELLGHLVSDSASSIASSDERAVTSSMGSAIKTAGKLGVATAIVGWGAGKTQAKLTGVGGYTLGSGLKSGLSKQTRNLKDDNGDKLGFGGAFKQGFSNALKNDVKFYQSGGNKSIMKGINGVNQWKQHQGEASMGDVVASIDKLTKQMGGK